MDDKIGMSLRRLFVSIGIIAAGLAIVGALLRIPPVPEAPFWTMGWCVAVGLIGFGLFHPFKRGPLGVLLTGALLIGTYITLAFLQSIYP